MDDPDLLSLVKKVGRRVFHCTFCILRHVDTTVSKYREKKQWDGIDSNGSRNEGASASHLSQGAQRRRGVAGVLQLWGCGRALGQAPRTPFGYPNRKTWQELSQACFPPADLVTAVQGAIHAIEGHSRDHLLLRVRALCQVMPSPPQHWRGVSSPRTPRQKAPARVSLDFCPAQQSLCWGGTWQR